MKRLLTVLVTAALLATAVPILGQQSLMASTWYAVAYAPENDTLHWINAQGEQGQLARPHLIDEAAFIDLRISPNGRTMVIAARLNSGLEALGVYDLESGSLINTHQAQVGERIHLGGANIFTSNSQYFAVGLWSGDFSNPSWRVILFDSASGSAAAFIDNTHPEAPQVPLSAPVVQVLDNAYVHFQLIPQSVIGGDSFPAFAWRVVGFDPAVPTLTESPYTNVQMQMLPLTGRAAMPTHDASFPTASSNGMNAIAVTAANVADPSMVSVVTIYADAARSHSAVRWALGGDAVLFVSNDGQGDRHWGIVSADGTPNTNPPLSFHADFIDAYGTADGYLLLTADHMLYYSNSFGAESLINIVQLSANSRIVYVTPIGVPFSLASIPNDNAAVSPPVVVVPPILPPQQVTPTACATALAPRVFVGGMGRVMMSTPTLNFRDQAGGAIVTTFSAGTTFFVTGGSACVQDLIWWQIERFGTVGWVAESLNGNYLIESYNGPMSADPTPTPLPEAQPPAAPVCGNALPPRLVVGSGAVMLDTVNAFNGPGGSQIALRWYESGTPVTVNAGPECVGGEWWWLITGSAKVGRIGQNYENLQAWVQETEPGAYNLSP